MAKQQQRRHNQPPARIQSQAPKKTAPAPVRRPEKRESIFAQGSHDFIFGRKNFIYMGAGLALILIGLAAMTGGAMPDPAVWEPERIYSFRRITLAPILMVAGFVAAILGIFAKPDNPAAPSVPDDNVPAA